MSLLKRTNSFASDWIISNNTFSGVDMLATITLHTFNGTIVHTLGNLQTISYSIVQNKIPIRCLGDINAKDYIDGPRTIAGSLVFAVFDRHWSYAIHDKLRKMKIYHTDHFIADELPPFDITISFANEYGYSSRLAIYGVRLIQEGQTMSVNDIYTENTYQYVAMDIHYMKDWDYINKDLNTLHSKISDTVNPIKFKHRENIIPNTEKKYINQKEYKKNMAPNFNFTYKDILIKNYRNFQMYKEALIKRKKEYLHMIKPLEQENTKQYNIFLQEILSKYNSKLLV